MSERASCGPSSTAGGPRSGRMRRSTPTAGRRSTSRRCSTWRPPVMVSRSAWPKRPRARPERSRSSVRHSGPLRISAMRRSAARWTSSPRCSTRPQALPASAAAGKAGAASTRSAAFRVRLFCTGVAGIIREIDPLALEDDGLLANLSIDRENVFADQPKEEKLHPAEKEQGDDEGHDAGLGEPPMDRQSDPDIYQGIEHAQKRENEPDEQAETDGGRREGNEPVHALIEQSGCAILGQALLAGQPPIGDTDGASAALERHHPHERIAVAYPAHGLDDPSVHELKIPDAGRHHE